MDLIYLDLKKTFHKVPHTRLSWKLEYLRELQGILKNWMEKYQKGREVRTVVKDEKTEWREMKTGVPLGSVLALIILVYVNGITE